MYFETTLFEVILKKALLGEIIRDENDNDVIISGVNHIPNTNYVFITDGINEFKVFLDDLIQLKGPDVDRIQPNKKVKIMRKRW